jgi:hypothetical protein
VVLKAAPLTLAERLARDPRLAAAAQARPDAPGAPSADGAGSHAWASPR